MANSEEAALKEGSQLGSYTIVRLLGAGGMGEVYEGVHSGLEKRVAIKTLHVRMAGDPSLKARFLREGKAASKIRHPHIVDVTDVGEANGVPYLVMEFLIGQDLAQKIEADGALPIQGTVDLMLPVCAAIAAAHDVDIVHRDLKPDNVYLAQGTHGIEPKVFDFGIAKVLEEKQNMALTGTAAVLGTPYYMSPEQARSTKNVGPLSDLYSLGVIMYEALTARRPFDHDTLFDLLNAIVGGIYIPLRAAIPQIPPELERIIACAMNVNPAQRFPSVRHFGQALLPFASDRVRALWTPEFSRVQPHQIPVPKAHNATAVMSAVDVAAAVNAAPMNVGGPQQFAQSGPQQFTQGGSQQFVQGGSQQFAQSSPQQFAQSGSQQFAQSGPQQFAQSGQQQLAQSGPQQQYAPYVSADGTGGHAALGQQKLEVTTFSGSTGERMVFEPPKKSKATMIAAAVAAIVMIGGGVTAAVVFSSEDDPAQPDGPTIVATPPTPDTPTADIPVEQTPPIETPPVETPPTVETPPAPTTYAVSVAVVPNSAALSLDGEAVGTGTFTREFPIDGTSHTLRVSAEGYETQNFTFRDEPPPTSIELTRVPEREQPRADRAERPIVRQQPTPRPDRPRQTSTQPRQGANTAPILY